MLLEIYIGEQSFAKLRALHSPAHQHLRDSSSVELQNTQRY